VLLVGGLTAPPARAQNQPQDPPPLDVNDVNAPPKAAVPPVQPTPAPTEAGSAPPAAQPPATDAAATTPSTGVTEGDGLPYEVSRFLVEWNSPNDQHPPVEELLDVSVTLGVTPQGYVSNGSPQTDRFGRLIPRKIPTVTVTLRDVAEGGVTTFYTSALKEINMAISADLNRRGLIAVYCLAAPDMIDPQSGDDLRERKTGDLLLKVWTGSIAGIRTVSSGDRLAKKIEQGKLTRIDADEPVARRIRDQSPVKTGDLVNRAMIDNYIFRLNRHPGRRVDAAIAAGEEPGTVALDYLVTENKPWTAYFQVSNTGTEETSVWRERFGYLNNQATGHDDIFSLDYITGNFDASNSVSLNYDFPLISDKLRWRNYANWSEYTASEVGFSDVDFSGENWMIGSELRYNLWQHRDWFVDGVGGVRWQDITVDNEASSITGNGDFFEPYIGADLQRYTDESSTVLGLFYYFNASGIGPERDDLGRPDVDNYFNVLRFQAEQTQYIEPLLNKWGWFQGKDGKGFTSLANEVAISCRGQWAFSDDRLIPNEEEVAGGMFTVRGYPQSIAAGDNVIIASAEYRFHIPNYLSVGTPGKLGNIDMPAWAGKDFRWTPQQAFGRADWDVVLKAFVDYASVGQNEIQPGESNDTLLGTGLGVDIRIKRNLDLRIDWGIALLDAGPTATEGDPPQVEAGDNEWYVLLTLSY
jgi:hemolysin activation/secretion protein